MSSVKNTILISAGISGIIGLPAQAQEKASLPVGTFELTPTLNVSLQKDSNVARTNTNKIDSWVSVINPQVTLGKEIGENSVVFGVNATKGIYHSSDTDNYDDYQIFASGKFEFDRRNRISGAIRHSTMHDSRGDAYSTGAGDSLEGVDEYKSDTFDFKYSFGALTASANLDVDFKYRTINYKTDILDFIPTRLRDRKEKTLGSTFYYGVSPVFDVLLEGKLVATDYDGNIENIASYNSDNKSLLLGAKWETTEATSGFAKVGYQKRDFDDASRSGFSGIKWEAGVAWNPIEYSVFQFSTGSDTQETNGQGNYIRRIDYVVDWRHEWLERFTTFAAIGYSDDSYEGGTTPRNDKTKDYKFRRWLKFTTSLTYTDKNSDSEVTFVDFEYNRTLLNFTARISL